MAELKTKASGASVRESLAQLEDPEKRRNAKLPSHWMRDATGRRAGMSPKARPTPERTP